MNCRRIEEQLPLYVEDDLESRQAKAVAEHLKGCASCSRLASEYAESQQWVRSSAAPEFDGAFFDDLRTAVLDRIERRTRSSLLTELVFGRWRGRWALAAGVAMLIVSALVLYLRLNDSRSSVEFEARRTPTPEVKEEGPIRERKTIGAGHDQKDTVRRRRVAAARRRALDQPPILETAQAESLPSQDVFDASLIDELAVDTLTSDPEHSEGLVGREDLHRNADDIWQSEPLDAGLRRVTTRIEIQTSDPAIRIIWLAPKPAEANQSKSLTDTY